MCGLTGYWTTSRDKSLGEHSSTIENMSNKLLHRGPDDSGKWVNAEDGIALGHRRLSILDLSSAGIQPMESQDGRFVAVYNGEIYNHIELRKELELCGFVHGWIGRSDTETMLAAISYWGIQRALEQFVGMFAIAIWDKMTKTLTLVRDRFGEKPLYYGWVNKSFVFASELKAITAYPEFRSQISREALTKYVRYGYVPAPRSIYKDIFKLEPGCILTVTNTPPMYAPENPVLAGMEYESLSVKQWWSMRDLIENTEISNVPDKNLLKLLEDKLEEAVKIQSLSDVPLGTFLSGGIDSSLIAALLQKQSSKSIITFTIGFDEIGFNEAPFAKAVAEHIGSEHHEERVDPIQVRDVIPNLPHIYDEPFADSSQIPTYLVCREARKHVAVALSGDAGDEHFGGYNRYFWGPRLWSIVGTLPYSVRQSLSEVLRRVPFKSLQVFQDIIGIVRPGEKLQKLAIALNETKNINDLYRNLTSQWQNPESIVVGENGEVINEPNNIFDFNSPNQLLNNHQASMMYKDTISYLPDDILCKVDRAAMSNSLETRAPFLDHRVVEMAWNMPMHMKIRGQESKWALRQILYKYVPPELVNRPKAGFAIPLDQWLTTSLKDWAEDLLDEKKLKEQGFLNYSTIRKAWLEHQKGRRNNTEKLWNILMFQAWLHN